MRPWAAACAQHRTGLAAAMFIMQCSLVLWPVAVRMASRLEQERQKLVLLNELATAHAPLPTERKGSEPVGFPFRGFSPAGFAPAGYGPAGVSPVG